MITENGSPPSQKKTCGIDLSILDAALFRGQDLSLAYSPMYLQILAQLLTCPRISGESARNQLKGGRKRGREGGEGRKEYLFSFVQAK